ncbi:MAG: hypothetical protein GOMPHAMPRED_008042 [Gomphillus americanus]|uniref:Zinc finger CHCC-type domain-containing protein n=1 Tax=Gomphillus americanus TaxID=1940652 RepID=A0A8H3EXX1_9LECA|nr:MAG: hypothetical protein GOMPHAMPRED_008042 [Gomphillus americanus]
MLPLTRNLRLRCPHRIITALQRTFATHPTNQQSTPDTLGSTSNSTQTTSEKITYSDSKPPKKVPNVSATNEAPLSMQGVRDGTISESVTIAEERRVMQAPNRDRIWSRSQQPRERAMSGPRFEQTIMELQPRPYAAIELIHKQPVRWVKERMVSCDGGGGPLGHPRIFINTDKPQICWCTYCGTPYANTQHRKYLESLPTTTYPLESQGNAAEVDPVAPQKVTDEAFAQR